MPLSLHERPLFGGAIHSLVSDRSSGVVHPDHPDFAAQIHMLRQHTGADVIFAQSLGMKTNVADLRAGAPIKTTAHPNFLRTQETADAVIMNAGGIRTDEVRQKVALLLMVADSPGVVAYDPEHDVLGFANGSMECLDPADGSDGIVTKMVERMKATGSDPHMIMMAVSACARACCFGYDMTTAQNAPRAARLTSRYGADVLTPAIVYPPRTGSGIDLGRIALRQAELAGVNVDILNDADDLCTAHTDIVIGSLDQGRFYSGIRGAKMGAKQTPAVGWNERGAMVVWA